MLPESSRARCWQLELQVQDGVSMWLCTFGIENSQNSRS